MLLYKFFKVLGTPWINKSRLAHCHNKRLKQESRSIFGRMEKSGKQELEEKNGVARREIAQPGFILLWS